MSKGFSDQIVPLISERSPLALSLKRANGDSKTENAVVLKAQIEDKHVCCLFP